MRSRRRSDLIVALAALALVGTALAASPPPPRDQTISVLEVDGMIDPVIARYLEREIAGTESALLVVRLDTPGGLVTSMRLIVQALLASPVPVVVWVAPSGARAASAGMFITIAGHVAAMAPGTNLGAAHPVALGGSDGAGLDKATEDAAALARSIAQARGRDVAWVERAVRDSLAASADEALRLGVIDLVADDLDSLLAQLDGRTVTTRAGAVTLRTAGARVTPAPMNLPERILHLIADPNIAYLLFIIGLLGLLLELYSPGLLLPGIVGVISLVLAFVAFGNLPVSWAGLVLILLAGALLVAELLTSGFGVLGIGGLVAFVVGSLMLYQGGAGWPTPQISGWLVGAMAALLAGAFGIVLRALARARRSPVATGMEALIGASGTALSELAPGGTVRVDREVWRACTQGAPIPAGEDVTVVDVEGVTVWVVPRPNHLAR